MATNEDFFNAFGRVCIQFSTLDLVATLTLLRLVVPNHRRGIKLNEKMTLTQKLLIIKNLKAHRVVDPIILTELHGIIPRAIAVAEKRNRYIHDIWEFKPSYVIMEGTLNRFRFNDLANWKFKLHGEECATIGSFQKLLIEIGTLQKLFHGLAERLPPQD
jgi:hypothetical protein